MPGLEGLDGKKGSTSGEVSGMITDPEALRALEAERMARQLLEVCSIYLLISSSLVAWLHTGGGIRTKEEKQEGQEISILFWA
jgi:hypothetical protein